MRRLRSSFTPLATAAVAVSTLMPTTAFATPADRTAGIDSASRTAEPDSANSADRADRTADRDEGEQIELGVGGSAVPRYTSHPEGGGTWIHGTDGPNNTAYSKFFHATRKHGSSVGNGQGIVNRTGTIAANKWANSSIRKTWAGNIAYYRFIK